MAGRTDRDLIGGALLVDDITAKSMTVKDIIFKGRLINIMKIDSENLPIVKGTVLKVSPDQNRRVTPTTSSSDTDSKRVVGIALTGATTANAEVQVVVGGEFQVLVKDGDDVFRGSWLRTSDTPGVAEENGTGSGGEEGNFAVAIEENLDPGEDRLVWARFLKADNED